MRFFAHLAAALLVAAPCSAAGLVKLESKFSVQETIQRLATTIEQKGLKVAARIDHAAAAKAAGLDLPATEVLIFGNPKLGTPLMQANPEIGIDLPLRILSWQDKDGKVWIGYTAPAEMMARHALTGQDAAFDTMAKALDGLARGASGQ